MTLRFKGAMGEPDAVREVWSTGLVNVGPPFLNLRELSKANARLRAIGSVRATVPYRIRIYIKPNKPKRGDAA